ncbi:hypothetical protein TSUD_339440 [Trifolium subterraneum]|nr:hypothetical protein TSUD_339440 [Trifolium subterraneum]
MGMYLQDTPTLKSDVYSLWNGATTINVRAIVTVSALMIVGITAWMPLKVNHFDIGRYRNEDFGDC